jgi:hypothetical protein
MIVLLTTCQTLASPVQSSVEPSVPHPLLEGGKGMLGGTQPAAIGPSLSVILTLTAAILLTSFPFPFSPPSSPGPPRGFPLVIWELSFLVCHWNAIHRELEGQFCKNTPVCPGRNLWQCLLLGEGPRPSDSTCAHPALDRVEGRARVRSGK